MIGISVMYGLADDGSNLLSRATGRPGFGAARRRYFRGKLQLSSR